jgi:hypothetical protein
MPATSVSSQPTGNPLLAAIDGGTRWSGVITYDRVSPYSEESRQFADSLPSPYVSDQRGLTDPMWGVLDRSLGVLRGYAGFSHAYVDAPDPNYRVGDFYRPDNMDTAGIAARPGGGPILAFSVRRWDAYTADQQTYIVMHEAAHTLGLGHPTGLPAELQFAQYTIMAYDWYTLGDINQGVGLPLTPMALDIAVLQANYGAPAANTGTTWYYLNRAGDPYTRFQGEGAYGAVDNGLGYICIWDTAGQDALVVSYDGGSAAMRGLLNLNAATLSTAAYTGALAEVIGEVQQTSGLFAGLSARTRAEITDPVRSAGGFFSSRIDTAGGRYPAGYTIANGVTIEEGRGGDAADLIIGNAAANVLEGGGGDDELYGGAGDDRLQGAWGDDRLFGGSGADTVQDWGGVNYLRGGDGDDSISGGSAQFDDLHGNQGNDTIAGGPGGDWLVGGQGSDLIVAADGADILYGNLGDDTLRGGAGAEIVRGGQGNDSLAGGAGADWLAGDRGDDTLTGGAGADVFHTFAEAGIDRVLDFSAAEGDRVQLLPGASWTAVQVGADVVVSTGPEAQLVLVNVQLSSLAPGWIFGA